MLRVSRAFLKKHGRIAFAILILAFVVPLVGLFTTTDWGQRSGQQRNVDLRIQGRKISQQELMDVAQTARLKYDLDPPRFAMFRPNFDQLVLERLMLLSAAKQLNIKPSQQQVDSFYQTYPPLRQLMEALMERVRARSPGLPEELLASQLQSEVESFLNGRRQKLDDLDRFVREEIMLIELRRVVTASAKVTPLQLRQQFEFFNEKLTIDVVDFPATDFEGTVQVTDEEIKSYYDDEKHKEALVVPARVKVIYVKFPSEEFKELVTLTDEDVVRFYQQNANQFRNEKGEIEPIEKHREKITEQLVLERSAQLAHDQAASFREKLETALTQIKVSDDDVRVYHAGVAAEYIGADGEPLTWEELRSKAEYADLLKALRRRVLVQKAMDIYSGVIGRKPVVTDFFTARGPVSDIKSDRSFIGAALDLTPEEPFSNVTQADRDFYVLGYAATKPQEMMTLEAAKEQIRKTLVAEKARDAAVKTAEERRKELQAKLDAGEKFEDAAKALNLKVISPKEFTLLAAFRGEAEDIPHASSLLGRITEMNNGDLSSVITLMDGATLLYLRERKLVDDETYEKEKARFADLLWNRAWQSVFDEWLNTKVAPTVSMGSSRR